MVVQDIDVDDIEDADDKDSMEWMEGVARYRKILHVCKLAAGAEEEKGRAAKGKYDLEVWSVMICDQEKRPISDFLPSVIITYFQISGCKQPAILRLQLTEISG